MTALEWLKHGRALLNDPEKWLQMPGFYCYGGRYCAAGALGYREEHFFTDTQEQAIAYLDRAVGDYVEEWNDHPTTTHAMVLEAYDRAIALAESGQ